MKAGCLVGLLCIGSRCSDCNPMISKWNCKWQFQNCNVQFQNGILGIAVMGMVLSLVARKGGVGKTSCAMNLAGAALQDGAKRVLLVDFDSQASLSKACLGTAKVESLRPDCTVQSVTEGHKSAGDVIQETSIPGLLIAPACPDLAIPGDGFLNLSDIDADIAIIDTPPDTKNPAVRCALMASHAVASPLIPEALGLQ
ncbi:MAG: ParA family protein, partial [Synechococcus sp.]|nr:ParA family protein [Synechococcus sp.]